VVLPLLQAATARAAEPRDPAAAEALFAEGQALLDKGNLTDACPKLEESYRLDPATGALYALALCHDRQGRWASAWVELLAVASRANAEGYPERERTARERAEALRARLSFLTVRVDPTAKSLKGLAIERNGVPLGAAAWDTPLPVDPGPQTIVVTAPGHLGWTTTHPVGAGPVHESVTVPMLKPVPPEPERQPPPPPPPRVIREASPVTLLGVRLTPLRTVGLSLGVGGVTALGLSLFSTVRAVDWNADSRRHCRPACTPQARDERLRAIAAADLATVSAVTGGLLLAGGAVAFVLGSPAADEPAVSVSPTGLRLRATF
jgi:hypothetical protein